MQAGLLTNENRAYPKSSATPKRTFDPNALGPALLRSRIRGVTLDKVVQTKAPRNAYLLRAFQMKAREAFSHDLPASETSEIGDDSA